MSDPQKGRENDVKSVFPKWQGIKLRKLLYPFILAIAILAISLPLAAPAMAAAVTIPSPNADGDIYSDSAVYTSAHSASTGTVGDTSSQFMTIGQEIHSNAQMRIYHLTSNIQ